MAIAAQLETAALGANQTSLLSVATSSASEGELELPKAAGWEFGDRAAPYSTACCIGSKLESSATPSG